MPAILLGGILEDRVLPQLLADRSAPAAQPSIPRPSAFASYCATIRGYACEWGSLTCTLVCGLCCQGAMARAV